MIIRPSMFSLIRSFDYDLKIRVWMLRPKEKNVPVSSRPTEPIIYPPALMDLFVIGNFARISLEREVEVPEFTIV